MGVRITGKVRKNAVLFAPAPLFDCPIGRGRPKLKGDRLAKPVDMFDHYLTKWDALRINLYAKERMFPVHRFHAV